MQQISTKRLLITLGVGLLWLLPSTGMAETKKRTCGSQPGQSLQHFLDELNPGDTLLVSGTCNENVVFGDGRRNLVIDGQGSATISGPNPNQPTVNIRGRNITIKGFTITGGQEGVHVFRGGSATIDDNLIHNVGTSGIGIHNQANAIIVNNTIQNNPDDGINVIGGSNAFIGIRSASNLVAGSNTIQNNGRRGVFVSRGSNTRIVGN
ncbi:MAG: right-handed parallel beta-helix repeat-containing protein, partial [Deltaproteobacteria bacterium]|nr:right-handed parallel beta-helix repeat-containing protein [Deltaproteobacteria bacterium]